MMGKTKDPPPFTLDKQYTQWKTEVKAWLFTADNTDKNKAALSIALSLPEKGCNSIRQRIFNSVTFFKMGGTEANPAEEISKDAWKDLIAFMDKEFAKDDIAELYDKTELFLHTVKREEDSMKEYINMFDDAFSQATKAGIGAVSSGFIMCLFMKNAGIDQKDFKFVASKPLGKLPLVGQQLRGGKHVLIDRQSPALGVRTVGGGAAWARRVFGLAAALGACCGGAAAGSACGAAATGQSEGRGGAACGDGCAVPLRRAPPAGGGRMNRPNLKGGAG